MRKLSVASVVAAASLAAFCAGAAQAEPDIWGAGKSLEMALFSVGQLKAAVELCGYRGMEPWDATIAAIDKRYARCVAQDSRWSQLERETDRKACEAKGMDASCGLGSVVVQINADGYIKHARTTGVQGFCDGFPWKWVLEPGPDNERAKADYIKADPRGEISMMLTVFDWVKGIGRNLDWVTAPCDKSFW